MVGSGETLFPAFLLAMGESQTGSGYATIVPYLLGSALQLFSPWGLARFGSFRRWIVTLCVLQAICFLPLAALAIAGRGVALWLIYLSIASYWIFGLAAAPAWNAWLASFVPARLRSRFLAKRNHLGQLGLISGLVVGGILLHAAEGVHKEGLAFAFVFLLACLARLASTRCLFEQSEREGALAEQKRIGFRRALRAIWRLRERVDARASQQRRFLGFLLSFGVAVHIASPFFAAFMLKQLHLSYGQYMGLVVASLIAKFTTFAILSRLRRQFEPIRLLRWGSVLAALSPIAWMVSPNYVYLFAIQLVAGSAWAMYDLGTALSYFRFVRDDERASLFSLMNFSSALMMFLGTSLGGQMLGALGESVAAYFVIFGVSTLVRFAVVAGFTGETLEPVIARVPLRASARLKPVLGAIVRIPVRGLGRVTNRGRKPEPRSERTAG